MTESSTTILRRLLDERGVRWTACSKATMDNQTFCNPYTFTEFQDGLMVSNLTPEQAIAATLGKQGYYTDRDDNGTHITCDKCGEYIGTAEEIAATLPTVDGNTRWHDLFGTPERAARTMAMFSPLACSYCALESVCGDDLNKDCLLCEHDALLEWLRGDV